MKYILALVGITLLCAAWVKFQLWLQRIDPQREGFRPGCGSCQGGSCSAGKPANATTQNKSMVALHDGEPGENHSGEEK
jgi:hypothetical protein